jgi:hypothetical protein
METRTFMGIFGLVVGTAFLLLALLLKTQPSMRRYAFVVIGICFYIYCGLEYFGIIQLEHM